jgi:hypothetical protein
MKLASSERRNAAAAACSYGDDNLPNGAANRREEARRAVSLRRPCPRQRASLSLGLSVPGAWIAR